VARTENRVSGKRLGHEMEESSVQQARGTTDWGRKGDNCRGLGGEPFAGDGGVGT
jgi:hypothetical protein